VATEAAWLNGKDRTPKTLTGKEKTDLTLTGLLMEGLEGYVLPFPYPFGLAENSAEK
jgi:hypothetical protein